MSRTFTIANAATHCPEERPVAKLRRLRREEGAALLEYAIIFILMMTLLFGIMGMGQMLYSYHFVSSVARDATRWAAVTGPLAIVMGAAPPLRQHRTFRLM